MIRSFRSSILRALAPAAFALVTCAVAATAQDEKQQSSPAGELELRPQIGLQTMWFNGDYPVRQDISPGSDRELPLGGGVLGSSNALRLGLEVIPSPTSIIRFPLTAEAYFLSGKTTFPLTRIGEKPTKRLTFTHTANIFSLGTGITLSFFKSPTLYFSGEARMNYISKTTLTTRLYVADNDSTEYERSVSPDEAAHTRFGAYLKVGTQAQFFDPFMLDFSIGYGGLNIGGRNTDPATGRNLMVVDPRNAPEMLLGYIGIGLSLIWKL